MTDLAARLLSEAMRLSEQERGELATRLIESLDPAQDSDREAAWGDEIRARLDELQSGQVQAISWTDARHQIMEDGDELGAG